MTAPSPPTIRARAPATGQATGGAENDRDGYKPENTEPDTTAQDLAEPRPSGRLAHLAEELARFERWGRA